MCLCVGLILQREWDPSITSTKRWWPTKLRSKYLHQKIYFRQRRQDKKKRTHPCLGCTHQDTGKLSSLYFHAESSPASASPEIQPLSSSEGRVLSAVIRETHLDFGILTRNSQSQLATAGPDNFIHSVTSTNDGAERERRLLQQLNIDVRDY